MNKWYTVGNNAKISLSFLSSPMEQVPLKGKRIKIYFVKYWVPDGTRSVFLMFFYRYFIHNTLFYKFIYIFWRLFWNESNQKWREYSLYLRIFWWRVILKEILKKVNKFVKQCTKYQELNKCRFWLVLFSFFFIMKIFT